MGLIYLTFYVCMRLTDVGFITSKIFILQKNAFRAFITHPKSLTPFNTHTSEYFKDAKNLKLTDPYESQISKYICSND